MINRLRIKRALDIVIAVVASLILVPLWLLIAICIFVENPGPVLFRQKRLGKDGSVFTIYKFRSMYVNNIPPLELGAVKHNHSLVTRVGYCIRRFKLDETPQILNVLAGQMSIVGPRPCLPERLYEMTQPEKVRLSVLPGLTGWAEVNGNVELSWQEQLWLDIWYVENWSLQLDNNIILKTIIVVLLGSRKNEVALDVAKELVVKINAPFNHRAAS